MGIGKKLDEIPIPFSDVKNIVEELRFEDELTRSRCRGWLVLQSKKFLQADIIFPGCNIDCRVSIRALTGDQVFVGSLIPFSKIQLVVRFYQCCVLIG